MARTQESVKEGRTEQAVRPLQFQLATRRQPDPGPRRARSVALLRARGITPVIARRETDHGSGLGVHRWVVEQTVVLLQ
jgi:hypothetical protein